MRPILSESGGMGNEYAFGTLFLWGGVYGSRYCRFEDFLLFNWGKDRVQYNFPIGKGDLKRVLGEMMEDARQRGDAFRMWGMTGSQCEQMEAAFPNTFVFTPDRDGSDYIYHSLPGASTTESATISPGLRAPIHLPMRISARIIWKPAWKLPRRGQIRA